MEFYKKDEGEYAEAGTRTKKQTRKEGKEKVGAALFRLQQSFSEDEADEDALLQEFLRELRKPRSREYIEQVKRCMELSERITERKTELARLQNAGGKGERTKGENPQTGGDNGNGDCLHEAESAVKTDTPELKKSPAWLPKTASSATTARAIEWKGTEVNRVQKELEQLEWELKQQQKQLYDRLPKGDPYLVSVYLSENEEELCRRGLIAGAGIPYSDVEELFHICNALSAQEQRMLTLADCAARDFPVPFLVEVYLHVVCKVFEDGSTQLIRG